jgi:hypothetical protein
MPDRARRRLAGGVIALVGAFLLMAAVFLPWYALDLKRSGTPSGSFETTTDYYLGLPSSANTIQYSCSYSGTGAPPSCAAGNSYSGLSLNNVGVIAEVSALLIWAGSALGIFAGALVAVFRKNTSWITPAIVLGILATIFGFAASGLFAGLLPGAFSKDLGSSASGGGGPTSSFWGSTSAMTPSGLISSAWGPSTGWYLALAGSGILFAGLVLLFLYRRDPAEPVPVAAPEVSGASGAALS